MVADRLGLRAICVALVALVLAEPAASQEGVTTLEQVISLARERNPQYRAARQAVLASGAREPAASTLPDPVFQIGVMNFSLPDFSTAMPMSMAPSVQLLQPVPFPGKLGLQGDIAEFGTGIVGAGAERVWWSVRTRTAVAFYEIYALDRRLEVTRETLDLLRQFETIAKAMYSAGTGRQADVLRSNVEIARVDGEITRMEARRRAMAARLNGLLDQPADSPVPSPVLDPLPQTVPSGDTLFAWSDETGPALEQRKLGVERAGSQIDLANKEIWPNFVFGVQYGQRDRGNGMERMGSIVAGFTLPIFAGRRQLPARDAATAEERMAQASLSAMRAEIDAGIDEGLADLDQARVLIDLYRDEILPESRATVESALSSYRVGSVDFLTLVDAQMTVNRFEGELYQLFADYGKGVAGLEALIGRPLPRTDELIVETP